MPKTDYNYKWDPSFWIAMLCLVGAVVLVISAVIGALR